jgi:hypothetical protein
MKPSRVHVELEPEPDETKERRGVGNSGQTPPTPDWQVQGGQK